MPLRTLNKNNIIPNRAKKNKQSVPYRFKNLISSLDKKAKLARCVDKCNALIVEYCRLRSAKLTVKRAQKLIDILDRLNIESALTQNRILALKSLSEELEFSKKDQANDRKQQCLSLFDTALTELHYCCDLPLLQNEKEILYFDMSNALGNTSILTHDMQLVISQKNAKYPLSLSDLLRSKKAESDSDLFVTLKELDNVLTSSEKNMRKKKGNIDRVSLVINAREHIITECKYLLTQPRIADKYRKELWRVIHSQCNHISNLVNANNESLKDQQEELRKKEANIEVVSACLRELESKLSNKSSAYVVNDPCSKAWTAFLYEHFKRDPHLQHHNVNILECEGAAEFLIENPLTGSAMILRQFVMPNHHLNSLNSENPSAYAINVAKENGVSHHFCEQYSYTSMKVKGDVQIFFELTEAIEKNLDVHLKTLCEDEQGADYRAQNALTYSQQLLDLVVELNEYDLYFMDIKLQSIKVDKEGHLKLSDHKSVLHRDHLLALLSESTELSSQSIITLGDAHLHDQALNEYQLMVLGYALYQIASGDTNDFSTAARMGCDESDPLMFDFNQAGFEGRSGETLKYHILRMTDPDKNLSDKIQNLQELQIEYKLLQDTMMDKGIAEDATFLKRNKVLIEQIYIKNMRKVTCLGVRSLRGDFIRQFQECYGNELALISHQFADFMRANQLWDFQKVEALMSSLYQYEEAYGRQHLSDTMEFLNETVEYFKTHHDRTLSDLAENLSDDETKHTMTERGSGSQQADQAGSLKNGRHPSVIKTQHMQDNVAHKQRKRRHQSGKGAIESGSAKSSSSQRRLKSTRRQGRKKSD